MKFNHKKVFDGFKAHFTDKMSRQQIDGLEFLLISYETDRIWSDVRHIAYSLATVWHETAYTLQPIQEYGSRAYFERRYGYQTRKGRELGNDAAGEGAKYSGKGFVQLTGESNYEKLEKIIRDQNPDAVIEFENRTNRKFDLTDYAEQTKDPRLAFLIMTIGMYRGIYTGYDLFDFINVNECDYEEARRIINGTDKAKTIAGYAIKFEKILRSAIEKEVADPILTDDDLPDALQWSHVFSNMEISASDADQNRDLSGNNFVPKTETVEAPPPSGMMKKALAWLAGFGLVPPSIATVVETAKSYGADGRIDWREVFGATALVAKFVFPYLVYIGIAFIVFWGVKELLKQATMLLQIWVNGKKDMNSVCVVPNRHSAGDQKKDSDESNPAVRKLLDWQE